MKYVNPPQKCPERICHKTFYSAVLGHELGYNIYLPPGYETDSRRHPVVYHLHGWTGSESSEIWTMEKICRTRQAITVFPNNSPVIGERENLPIEEMLISELIPHIDSVFRTDPARENRAISGFSMGGGMAFYFAVKHPELFSKVTAYAGTYHHYYHRAYSTVGAPPERAAALYQGMLQETECADRDILRLLCRNRDAVCGRLRIVLHIGTEDVLYCDNEILRLHLEALRIPHVYREFSGAGHTLEAIL